MRKRGVVLAVFAALATGLVAGANASDPDIPTGGSLVYAGIDPADGMSDIYVKSPTGSTTRNITHDQGTRKDVSPSFSPDGSKIAFVRSAGNGTQIMVVNADGSGLVNVTPAGFQGASNIDPRWSGDGGRIVFSSNVDGNYDLYWTNAVGITSTRSIAHRLTKTQAPVVNRDPSWTRNGKSVVFSRSGHRSALTNWAAELFQLDVTTLQAARLTKTIAGRGDVAPVYSPDNRSVAFSSDRSGNEEIYVLSLETKSLARLTNNPARDIDPAWSPDGTAVAFVSTRNKGATEVFAQNLLGLTPGPTAPVQLTFDGADKSHPDWGATATQVGFVGAPVETPLPTPTSRTASPAAR